MSRFISNSVTVVFRTGFFSILTACQSSTVDDGSHKLASALNADTTAYRQLIIKFKDKSYRCVRADIARLEAQIDVPLELTRPLSEGTCVIKIRQIRSGSGDFDQGQKLLQEHPSIEWVERDAILKAM